MAQASTQATRLAELRRNSGLTLEQVAEKLKKNDPNSARSFGAIARYEKDDSIRLNIKTLNALAKLYKSTPEYIERGGTPVATTSESFAAAANARLRPTEEFSESPLYLPRVPVRARASFSESFSSDADFGEFELSLIRNPTPEMRKEGSIELEIDGDSMDPTLHSGWFVACTIVEPGDFKYMPSGVYAIVFGNYFVVKRIKDNDLSRDGTLTLHSDNDRAGSLKVDEADIRRIWRVVSITHGKII